MVLSVIALLGIGGTVAYLSSYDAAKNEMTIEYHDSGITEEFPSVTPVPITESPRYKKDVKVANSSSTISCYVRARFVYSDDSIGKAVVIDGLNTTDWVLKPDGYYYYKMPVKSGEKTRSLFTGFHIDYSKVNVDYAKAFDGFAVDVYEESIEADLFSNYESAWAKIDKKGA